jgi:hypothetical protein
MAEYLLRAGKAAASRASAQGRGHGDVAPQKVSPHRFEGNAALNVGSGPNKAAKNAADTMSAEQVLRAFNTWAFKREQPSDPQLLLRVIGDAIVHNAPLPFLFYWGKGPRCHIDAHDHKCLDYLEAMAHRISAVYPPGAAMRLICTDTHAALNGYPPNGIRTYFSEIEAEAHRRGFECFSLKELIDVTMATAEDDQLSDHVPADMLEKLFTSAMKWYHGAGTAEEGAIKYFHMNMIEKRAVEIAFPNAIFATFNSSKFRILFPKRLPIFYMYALQRGVGVKPWFLPAEAQPCDATSCTCIAKPKDPAGRT